MTMDEHEEGIQGIDPQPPEGFDNHESLVLAVHYNLMPNQSKPGGDPYQTIPHKIKTHLANSTGGCSRAWATNTQKQRVDWWHRHYDNLRFYISDGDEGSEGGAATQNTMRSANEYWTNNQTDALRHAMTCFYKDHAKDSRDLLISEMGENPDDWDSYISEFGQEFVEPEDAEPIEEEALDQGRLSAAEGEDAQDDGGEVIDDLTESEWFALLGAPPPAPGEDPIVFKPVLSEDGTPLPRNWILYGGPGTGKSYNLDKEAKRAFRYRHTRVTFHSDFTNGNFVGSYRPVPVFQKGDELKFTDQSKKEREDVPGTPHILYEFVPGPFLEALVRAYDDLADGASHLLIIEEINRANPSAVLGEVFQMLDRHGAKSKNGVVLDGYSKYPVSLNSEAMGYLDRATKEHVKIRKEVGLPPNLYIWATMNTTDEGVFPVDSAFRRRWTMKHVSVDKGEGVVKKWMMPSEFAWLKGVSWNDFRKKVNEEIVIQLSHSREDQLLGPFFFSEEELKHPERVKNKLLDYLHQSLFRHSPNLLFKDDYKHGEFSKLMGDFDNKNVFKNIFKESDSEDGSTIVGGSANGTTEEE